MVYKDYVKIVKSTKLLNLFNKLTLFIVFKDLRIKVMLPIPITRRVKKYTRIVRKYVIRRRKRFRPYKVYIF